MKALFPHSPQLNMSLMIPSSIAVLDARARADVVRALAEMLLAAAEAVKVTTGKEVLDETR